jgi:two-component system, OmpR family, sensor histidine kinase TctE
MPDMARPPSIRRRLLLFLIPSLLFIVICAAAITYRVALSVATSAYDRSLLDPALDIIANVRMGPGGPQLTLLAQAQAALLFDHEDTLVFQVRGPEEQIIAGSEDLGTPPALMPGQRYFFDGMYRDEPVRIAAVRSENGLTVQVGETLHKRNSLIWQILGVGLLPTLIIAIASLGVAWTVVEKGLSPLARLKNELLGRTPDDLQPLQEHGAPIEIAPVITAFNSLLAKLSEASAKQQRFLADAAHQLRTPLAGLQMHLELLLRRPLGPEIRDQVAGMHTATIRASHLANQLLALAKAEASDQSSSRLRPVDLYAVADEAAQEWVPRAIARNVDLGFVLEHAEVAGDPILLSEMLDNLVDNALRYTPSGGAVTVRSGCHDASPYISVEDTGPGVPKWAQKKVFDRFYRVDGSPGDGSGLGLAIVKEVVERHGGALGFDAQYANGAKIVVNFPRRTAA